MTKVHTTNKTILLNNLDLGNKPISISVEPTTQYTKQTRTVGQAGGATVCIVAILSHVPPMAVTRSPMCPYGRSSLSHVPPMTIPRFPTCTVVAPAHEPTMVQSTSSTSTSALAEMSR
jgi:hypothetical protein